MSGFGRQIRLIIFAILYGLLFIQEPSLGQERRPRLDIELFNYHEALTGEERGIEHIIDVKIKIMVEELKNRGSEFGYLDSLSVVRRTDDVPNNIGDLHQYWQGTQALEILSGIVDTDAGTVISNIYIGDLQGSLKSEMINIQMEIAPDEFRSFRDMHSLLTLYALAVDARARHGNTRELISTFLSEAWSIVQDLLQRPMDLKKNGDQINMIQEAIQRDMQELRD